MFIDRIKERDASYRAKADKKTKVNLQNTFRKPPIGHFKGAYIRSVSLEGMPGYTPRYNLDQDEIRDDTKHG